MFDTRSKVELRLPEGPVLCLEAASAGSRALAYAVDFCLRWGGLGLFLMLLFFLKEEVLYRLLDLEYYFQSFTGLSIAFTVICFFLVEWSYPIFFDVFRGGVSPGKAVLKLRVVTEQGLPLNFRTSLLRNIFLIVDLLPSFGLVGIIMMLVSKENRRTGDFVAGTLVIHEPHKVIADDLACNLQTTPLRAGQESQTVETSDPGLVSQKKNILLPSELFAIIQDFLERRGEIIERNRRDLALQLLHLCRQVGSANKGITAYGSGENLSESGNEEQELENILLQATPVNIAQLTAVESSLGRNTWQEFLKLYAQTRGEAAYCVRLAKKADDVRSLMDRYRLLIRLFGLVSQVAPQSRESRMLQETLLDARRKIFATRNLDSALERTSFQEKISASFQLVVRHVILSLFLFFGVALLSYLIVRSNSSLSWHFLSDSVVAQLKSGKLWTDNLTSFSAIASSQIVTNNISVSLLALALGITGGLGTALILVVNAVMLGGIFASLEVYGMGNRLLEFVLAHGILELSVIAVSGGMGFFIGDSIIKPGEHTRVKSLQGAAKSMVPLVLINGVALVLAGLVEGYVSSAPTQGIAFKGGIGVLLGVLYWSTIMGCLFPKGMVKHGKQQNETNDSFCS